MLSPQDVPGWARAMEEVAASPDLREKLSRLGRENVQRFSWRDTAQKTLEAIEAAARS